MASRDTPFNLKCHNIVEKLRYEDLDHQWVIQKEIFWCTIESKAGLSSKLLASIVGCTITLQGSVVEGEEYDFQSFGYCSSLFFFYERIFKSHDLVEQFPRDL